MAPAIPINPRADYWYREPPGYKYAQLGAILRLRVAPGDLTSIFRECSAAYNILFRTTDSDYKPSWAVTTLLIPKVTDGDCMLSYQIPYNSVDLDASASFLLHKLNKDYCPNIIKEIDSAATRGWYLNIPDFEGPGAAFCDGVVAGHVTLDSISAVLNAGFGLVKEKTETALWGYSGGAFASAWAAELHAHYAPELRLAGAALGGLPATVPDLMKISGTQFAGLIPQVLLGTLRGCPDAYGYLLSQLKDSHKAKFLAAQTYDVATGFLQFDFEDVFRCFENGCDVLRHRHIEARMTRIASLGHHGVPKIPLFLYKNVYDRVASIEATDQLVEKWSRMGVVILYERNSRGDHLSEATTGMPRALKWLQAVLDGTSNWEGCTIKNVAIAPDQDAKTSV